MSTGSSEGLVLDDLSDEELIAGFLDRGGRDERPFTVLLRRHRGLVWRVALGFFGNPQDAEDMTQEVFFTAYRKLNQFKGEASFRTWLHRIATNRCKNELRRRSRRLRTAGEPFEEIVTATVDASPGPEEVTIGRRGLQRLALAMESLSREERALLRLVEIDQTPYREVAETLGLSVGAVKMRVLRARAHLREVFDSAATDRQTPGRDR